MDLSTFMSELEPLSADFLIHLAGTLQIPMKGLVATIELLDEGSTVPFIARYRKESTGNLDEVQIRALKRFVPGLRASGKIGSTTRNY